MEPSKDLPENAAAARTVAAIDLGATSIRMVIAEVLPDGRLEVLERLQRAVRLGQDTFRRGRLGGQSMRAALNVLKDYRQVLRLYRVEQARAVATSAVREASNADTFLDRVFLATGLHVEVIDTSEESRLTVSAVRQAWGSPPAEDRAADRAEDQQETLIANVGGGSTLLTVLQGDEIITSQGLRLGSIRLQEVILSSGDPPQRSAGLLRYHIGSVIASVQGSLPLGSIGRFVAVGGDARFVARQIGKPAESADLVAVDLGEFDKLVDRCQRHTAEELSRRHGLPFAEAETLTPALLIYQILLRQTGADRMIISHASMCDGLLLELTREVTGQEDEALLAGVIHSATTLAEKYRADAEHGRSVAELAVRLFDDLQADHGLGARHRLLLRVAGLLHEIGGFVSNRSHHKHSQYLIANSEIFGLKRGEIAIVAEIARYHRRSVPRPTHPAYMALTRETRVVVAKLAALLRVADALARGTVPNIGQWRIERQGDDLVVGVPGGADLLLKQRAIAAKGDLFEDIFGMKVRLEEG
jgi:exopolyphosphatase/guanosine-5'-triphosphate,3'-diphosphate pyrophosphatase